jgi:hypothetical protein
MRDNSVSVTAKILNVEYKMLNDRKISYRAVVEVRACAEEDAKYDYVSDLSGLSPSQVLRTPFSLNKTVERRADRFVVRDELSVSHAKPGINELLQTDVCVVDKDVKVSNGRVHVNGCLVVSVLYRGDDAGLLEFTEHELPFNGSIDLPNAREGMFCDVELTVSSHTERVKQDADGEDRVIEIEAVVAVMASAQARAEIHSVTDAYCIGKTTALTAEKITYPNVVCRNKNQTTIKDVVIIAEDAPDILQVFRATGVVRVTDMRVVDDKVVAEGLVEADILYIAKNDDMPLYNHKEVLPFKQVIEARGANAGMEAVIETSIDHTGFNMLSGREVEIRFLVSFNTVVRHDCEHTLVTDITFADIERETLEALPSMTIYVTKDGDTLWSVAKRFNTEIEELTEINELEGDRLKEGTKLLILKKTPA